jgi:transglutaminase-like putative cysteine protease
MTPSPLQTRRWVVIAAALAQLATARAGMLPWWALPVTIALTLATLQQTASVDERRSKLAQRIAVGAVAAFALSIVVKAVAAGREGADPLATMRLLTEALVVLSLIMAPTWRSARDYRVWLSVTTGLLVAATFGSHSVTTDVLLVATWILVLLATVSVQRTALLESTTVTIPLSKLIPLRRRPLRVGAPVIASLVAAALVFLALPGGLGGGGLARHLVHSSGDGVTSGEQSGRSIVGVDTIGDGILNLLLRGALSTTPLLRVPADSPPLWRGSIYTTYTGQSWQADPNQKFEDVQGATPTVPPSQIDPRAIGRTRTDQVQFVPGVHSSLLWAPGVPLRVQGDGGDIQGIARDPANVRILGVQQITGYTVTSAVATTSPATLSAAHGTAVVGAEWTTLPAELPRRVSQLAHQITAGTTNRLEQVSELETYLRTHETYSLNSPIPGANQDAVADFLFRDHIGFCEQFASAEAVMLRTLGVPARVVSGLAYGTRQGSTRLFTDANAHAWVEVYYPGVGWSPTDPTAGVALASGTSTSRSSLSALLNRIANHLPGGRAGLVALLVILILAALSIARTMRVDASRLRRTREVRPANRPVLTAFNRFSGAQLPGATRSPEETAREYIARLPSDAPLETAVATLEQECYGNAPPTDREVLEAVAAFDGERAGSER